MDVFRLWEHYYSTVSPQSSMADRMRELRSAFRKMIVRGLGSTGVRMIDHGVASGLLVLLYTTFYYQAYFALGDGSSSWREDLPGLKRAGMEYVRHCREQSRFGLSAWNWWAIFVWASAASALHNLQQLPQTEWPIGDEHLNRYDSKHQPIHGQPLRLEDDPLAFLGILVDVLQEWDRYRVGTSGPFMGHPAVQGKDVRVECERGKLAIDYQDQEISRTVRKTLTQALAVSDLKPMIEILPGGLDSWAGA